MNHNFLPLLFGGDINVYSVARAFHQQYGVKSIAYGKYLSYPCAHSDIIDYRPTKNIDTAPVFLQTVATVCGQNPDKTVLVIGCGDSYVQLAADFQGELPENAIAPYISGDLMHSITDKEQFYALCDQYGVPHPKTFVYRGEMGHDFEVPFTAPYIAKPADGVAYWQHSFAGIKKVYVCDSWQELLDSLDAVYAAGYPGAMILQEFIPGDDSNMRVLTSYSDRDGDVTMMCLGHVLMEEHSPKGIGNHAAILTDCHPELSQQFKKLLEGLNYTGFSNFDIKYDPRDGEYKAFEINTRQGRSNFYVTGGGHNIAKILVDDRILGEKKPLEITKNRSFWTMAPKWIAFRFIPKQYHQEIKSLISAGAYTNPLYYKGDGSIQRRVRRFKSMLGITKRFLRYSKKP